ncbi:MAG TPA: universal stress protein [Burkholderiales bacterium]
MRVLVASDGSQSSRAALELALSFPWPPGTQARGAVALGRVGWTGTQFRAALIRALHASARELQRDLARRWPEAAVYELHDSPAQAILGEARRFRADAVVLGWRGHGAFARLLAGSVSRAVAERAKCSVMVVRAGARLPAGGPRRFAIGFDGSASSRRAIRLLARLAPPRDNAVTLVQVLPPPLSPPLSAVGTELRARIRRSLERRAAELRRRAQRRMRNAAGVLERRGWQVSLRLASGDPLHALLAEARRARADALWVGARGATGLAGVLLGSVASGALNQSPIPVLIAR